MQTQSADEDHDQKLQNSYKMCLEVRQLCNKINMLGEEGTFYIVRIKIFTRLKT